MTEPQKPKVSEHELRAMLAGKARILSKAIVSKHCRQLFKHQAESYHWLWAVTEQLATMKRKRSPKYHEFCRSLLAQFAEFRLGHLTEIPEDTLPTLEKLFDMLIAVISEKAPPVITGPEFVSLTKRLFVPKKRPGPHLMSKYDQAFVRRTKAEKLSDIIKDLEPEEYARDPYATTQRFSAAIRLRKKRAARI